MQQGFQGAKKLDWSLALPALILAVHWVVWTPGCGKDKETARSEALPPGLTQAFTDVTESAGIKHSHNKPVLDHKLDNIMSWVCSVGAAAAAGDFDNDGWIDLYVTNSHKGTPNYLYRNNRDGTFTDVAKKAGLADVNGDDGVSMDCIWGDYDNDGWKDLFLVRWGRNSLFRNNGDGTFTEVTSKLFRRRATAALVRHEEKGAGGGSPKEARRREADAGTDWANGNAAVFLDFNLDGRLDIYVGNYFDEIDLWDLKTTKIMHDSFENARNAGRNFMYRQEADGTFTEVAKDLGLDDPGWTLAVGSADINNDGWPDIYCADDFGPDQLFLSQRDGTFKNVTKDVLGSDTKKGMNVDFGDFNNDGWLDIYVTNITTAEYLQEGNMLWHNNGVGPDGMLSLTDISLETGTYDGGWGWGAKFFDYDNDGDLDLIAANGFISAGEGNYWYDLASWSVLGQDPADAANWPTIGNRSFSGYERERFWRNDGMGSFTERAEEVGLATTRDGRGVAYLDYDNDGDLDLYIANQGQPPHLYRNNGGTKNHWLLVELEVDPTTGVNRDAVGSRVTVLTAKGMQIRERDGGNGYCGQSDPRVHFGLGADKEVKLLEVRWPDGGLQYLEHVKANRQIKIRQDRNQYASQMAMKVTAPQPRGDSADASRPKGPPPEPADLERHLAEMETMLLGRPQAYGVASTYRSHCATYGRHDRSIKFFQKLVSEKPDDWRARVELACAYIDKIPTCGGMAAIVSKGTLARKSLDQLDQVIADLSQVVGPRLTGRGPDADLWVGYYTRGMNHLHWPRALLHSDDAVADLSRCIELQRKSEAARPENYFVRTYVALGDAFAKAKKYDRARDAWRQGTKLFSASAELKERLSITDNSALLKFVESKRSLEQPVDTGLSFLDPTP